jgi:NADH:ubiquinone oxidoreductase subunit H
VTELMAQYLVIMYESAILGAIVLVVFGIPIWLVRKATARAERRRNGVEGSPPVV